MPAPTKRSRGTVRMAASTRGSRMPRPARCTSTMRSRAAVISAAMAPGSTHAFAFGTAALLARAGGAAAAIAIHVGHVAARIRARAAALAGVLELVVDIGAFAVAMGVALRRHAFVVGGVVAALGRDLAGVFVGRIGHVVLLWRGRGRNYPAMHE